MLIIINAFAIYYPSLPTQIPLFYSLPEPKQKLVTLPQFTILPFTIALIILVNLFLSWQLHSSQIALKRMLSASIFVIALLLTITAIKIISIYI